MCQKAIEVLKCHLGVCTEKFEVCTGKLFAARFRLLTHYFGLRIELGQKCRLCPCRCTPAQVRTTGAHLLR
jgi:hypothetical protein